MQGLQEGSAEGRCTGASLKRREGLSAYFLSTLSQEALRQRSTTLSPPTSCGAVWIGPPSAQSPASAPLHADGCGRGQKLWLRHCLWLLYVCCAAQHLPQNRGPLCSRHTKPSTGSLPFPPLPHPCPHSTPSTLMHSTSKLLKVGVRLWSSSCMTEGPPPPQSPFTLTHLHPHPLPHPHAQHI